MGEDGGDVDGVGAVGVDVGVSGGAGVGEDGVVDGGSFVDGVLEVGGCPQHAGVDDEGVAVRLGGLVVVLTVTYFAGVGEGDEAAQVVECFAPVELALHPAAVLDVAVPAQRVHGAQQLAVLDECSGEGMLA